jgi:hypothetical protein
MPYATQSFDPHQEGIAVVQQDAGPSTAALLKPALQGMHVEIVHLHPKGGVSDPGPGLQQAGLLPKGL